MTTVESLTDEHIATAVSNGLRLRDGSTPRQLPVYLLGVDDASVQTPMLGVGLTLDANFLRLTMAA